MAAFTKPFNVPDVDPLDDVTIELPDPYDPALPPISFDDPITREGVARYAGSELVLMHVQGQAASFNLRTPVSGTARQITLDAGTAAALNGTSELIEIEPQPFAIASTLHRIKPGAPTFYIGYSSPALAADAFKFDFLTAGSFIADVDGDAYLGVCFQDGAALAPWEWIEILRRAMFEDGDTAGAGAWNELAALYDDVSRRLRILDHRGRPFAENLTFSVRVNGQPAPDMSSGPNSELTLPPGDISLQWQGDPPADDNALPVQARYSDLIWDASQDALSSKPPKPGEPNEPILLPSDFERGHLQVLDLSAWFSRRPDTPLAPSIPSLPRFHANSRMEPLIDGIAAFKPLVDDMLASNEPGSGSHLAGWAFNDFPMVKGLEDGSGPIDTSLPGLVKHIRDRGSGGDIRMMFDKFVQLKDGAQFSNTVERAVLGLFITTISAATIIGLLDELHPDEAGYLIIWTGAGLGLLLIDPLITGDSTTAALEEKVENSLEMLNTLNAADADDPNKPMLAAWARHPVSLRDNDPLLANLDLLPDIGILPEFKIVDIQDRFGSWHQKIQAIKRPSPDDPTRTFYVGYAGGIDINKNRIDSPGHQSKSPYHDVHARVTGPAAWDIHRTWLERYDLEKEQYATIDGITLPDPAFTVDSPDDDGAAYPEQAAKHLIQVGRTYARPSGSGMAPMAFAPDGEHTIYETYLRAIQKAREYIYIEDQYFTPNTGAVSQNAGDPALGDPGNVEVFMDVLLKAANHCKRLVVTVPLAGDQPFGHDRRAFLISLLRERWGDRMYVGAPLRRPFLPETGRTASKGRLLLLEDIAQDSEEFKIGPASRLPGGTPFWLWIYGELMLCTRIAPGSFVVDGVPAKKLILERGPVLSGADPRWGAKPREHKAGAPVTLARLKGPYVHAKLVLIDDIFASVGSANLNRRGFFHDGEIQIFAVPEQLKAAPDNPALALRTALWAEHLGIPPAMGAALLSDPIAAFEYFRRSRYQGNRSAPAEGINERPELGGDVISNTFESVLQIATFTLMDDVWNTFVDPSTTADPDPTRGPIDS